MGLVKYKFYYIFPEYKAPNLIYTDDYNISVEDISRNFELNEDYETTVFRENDILENILKDSKENINFFVNSYLIEISNSDLSDIRHITFTNYRKLKNQIQTIIKTDKVIKRPITKEAENHIKEMISNMEYFPKENCVLIDKPKGEITVESDFINGKRLDEIIENSKNVKEEFEKYKEFLFKTNEIIDFEEIDKNDFIEPLKEEIDENLKKFHFVKYGFIDMIPKNCFVVGGINFFFDQEWMLKFIPVEYIFYRAIKNTYSIDREKLYSEFDLNNDKELFEKIEDYFRNIAVDKTILEKILAKPIYLKDDKINTLEEQKQILASAVQDRDNKLIIISNSLSWKITKPLRWASEKLRNIKMKFKK